MTPPTVPPPTPRRAHPPAAANAHPHAYCDHSDTLSSTALPPPPSPPSSRPPKTPLTLAAHYPPPPPPPSSKGKQPERDLPSYPASSPYGRHLLGPPLAPSQRFFADVAGARAGEQQQRQQQQQQRAGALPDPFARPPSDVRGAETQSSHHQSSCGASWQGFEGGLSERRPHACAPGRGAADFVAPAFVECDAYEREYRADLAVRDIVLTDEEAEAMLPR